MPYCVHCGQQVQDRDVYCGNCGSRQKESAAGGSPGGSAPTPGQDILSGINSRAASMFCYVPVIGWVPAIIVLASSRFRDDRTTRFHAWQGLYLFVAWLLVEWVATPFFEVMPGPPFMVKFLKGIVLAGWVFMLVKVSQDQMYRLPIIGELAERSVSEQR